MVTDMERRKTMKYIEPKMEVILFDKTYMVATVTVSEGGGPTTEVPDDGWN